MSEDPVDISSLDPDSDPDAARRFVAEVLSRVDALGQPVRPDAFAGVVTLARPLLVAASVLLALLLANAARRRGPVPTPARTVAEAVGVPPEFLGVREDQRGGVR